MRSRPPSPRPSRAGAAPRAALALAVALAGGARAQGAAEGAPPAGTGRLEGRLTACAEAQGEPAELVVQLADGRVERLTPGRDGGFRLEALPPGEHEVHAYAPGCETASYRVRLAPGGLARLDVTLPAAASLETTVEVAGRRLTAGEKAALSAEAVRVVPLEEARRQSADLGEVLARVPGISVQRTAGLGSPATFSLDGLSGEQVRLFLDGVPLEHAGFGAGLANVPIPLLERVEVYRGVVPVRFGADALGGAVNLVSAPAPEGGRASAALQAGSFGTWRGVLSGGLRLGDGGAFVRGHLFGDLARNDYPVDVEVADAAGALQQARVPRFHDAYRAAGAHLEVGVADASWAERLSLRLYGTRSDKELQHGATLAGVPAGEAASDESAAGALLHFARGGLLGGALRVEAVGGYGRRDTSLVDVATTVYDWYGKAVRERRVGGELGGAPIDQRVGQQSALSRIHLGLAAGPSQTLRLTLAPTLVTREGEDRARVAAGERDPLEGTRRLLTAVAGLEHEARLLDGQLESVAFLKGYLMRSTASEVLSGGVAVQRDQRYERLGAGEGLRLLLATGLVAKASYEYATRLPTPDEVFGNGTLLLPSLGLRPETSHNVNVELGYVGPETALGALRAQVGGFARLTDRLVIRIVRGALFVHQNVDRAHAFGGDVSAGWTAPGGWLSVDANTTLQDFRAVGTTGPFAAFAGDRIPNKPWLLANLSARLERKALLQPGDAASLTLHSRYVHGFYLGWESLGRADTKLSVPAQLTHALGLTYALAGPPAVTATLEALNLTDARVYDFYGVQRPGRSLFLTLGVELGR
jgi:outer membrane receptor protein involved in Fe transport